MTAPYNPALFEEARNQPIKIIPPRPRESLLSWLESSGRFHASKNDVLEDPKMTEDLDDILEPELYALDSEDE